MSAPPRVHLRVLQPEAIRAPNEMLRCEPFAAIIPARTCVARRRETYVGGRSQHGPGERHYAYLTCRQCAVGEQIERQIAGHA